MAILVKKIHITEDGVYYRIHEDSGKITYCRKNATAKLGSLSITEEIVKTLCEYILIRQTEKY